MRFDIAKDDAARASEDQVWELYVFQLPNRAGDGDEDYAAVKPSEELLLTLTQDVYLLQESPQQSIDILNRILLQVFNPEDLYEALVEDGGYEDTAGDGDGDISAAGLELVRSSARLKYRHASRRDPLGTLTIAQIAVHMVERWSGKEATGKPRDFLPRSSTTGTRSKRTGSSRSGSPATRSRSSKALASRDS
jgi:hypothetical protein